MDKLCAKELRTITPEKVNIEKIARNDLYIILDNVLDTYNVGAIFRLADAVGVKKIYLCGQTETPPNSRIKKASVNTWQWIDWEYKEDITTAINELRKNIKNIKIYAVEQSEKSKHYDQIEYTLPIAFIVGNESYGISQEILDKSDKIIELPMLGINKSLNVMVSLGIALYQALEKNNIFKK